MNICEGQEYWVIQEDRVARKLKLKQNPKTKLFFFKTPRLFEDREEKEVSLKEEDIKAVYAVRDNEMSQPVIMKMERMGGFHSKVLVERVIYQGLDIEGRNEIVIFGSKESEVCRFEYERNLIDIRPTPDFKVGCFYSWPNGDYYMPRGCRSYLWDSGRTVGKYERRQSNGDYLFWVNGYPEIVKGELCDQILEEEIFYRLEKNKRYWVVDWDRNAHIGAFLGLRGDQSLKYIFSKDEHFQIGFDQDSIYQVFASNRPSPVAGPLSLIGQQVVITNGSLEFYGELLYQGESLTLYGGGIIYKDSEMDQIKALFYHDFEGIRIYRLEDYNKHDKYEIALKNGKREVFYKGETIVKDIQQNKYFVIKRKQIIREFLQVDIITITKNKEEFNG